MPNEVKTYNCICGGKGCGKEFISTNELDTDGDGLCSSCEEKAKIIAENVQKIIDQKRANRPPSLPNADNLPIMPGTNFINSRFLR